MGVQYCKAVLLSVENRETLARIAQAHTAAIAVGGSFAQPRTVVDDGKLQHVGARAPFDADHAAALAGRDRIFYGVFDQGLQQQAWQERLEGVLFDRVLEAQPVAEAQALRIEVQVERFHLLAQRDLFHRILIEAVAQELRQTRHRVVRDAILVIEDQRGDRIQRVEEKMGIQLVTQHFQLRFLSERGGLEGRLSLLLQRLVILDTKIQRAPAEQQISHPQGTRQDLKYRLELPGWLDEILVGEIDDDAQGKGDRVARGRYAHDHRSQRMTPEAPVDVAQGRRQHEAGDGGNDDDLVVGDGLGLQQGAKILADGVSAPARGVQSPEEGIETTPKLLERHLKASGRPVE